MNDLTNSKCFYICYTGGFGKNIISNRLHSVAEHEFLKE